jgi:hypothetical protein
MRETIQPWANESTAFDWAAAAFIALWAAMVVAALLYLVTMGAL